MHCVFYALNVQTPPDRGLFVKKTQLLHHRHPPSSSSSSSSTLPPVATTIPFPDSSVIDSAITPAQALSANDLSPTSNANAHGQRTSVQRISGHRISGQHTASRRGRRHRESEIDQIPKSESSRRRSSSAKRVLAPSPKRTAMVQTHSADEFKVDANTQNEVKSNGNSSHSIGSRSPSLKRSSRVHRNSSFCSGLTPKGSGRSSMTMKEIKRQSVDDLVIDRYFESKEHGIFSIIFVIS